MDNPVVFMIVFPILVGACARMLLPSVSLDMDFDKNHGTFLNLLPTIQRPFWYLFAVGIISAYVNRMVVGPNDASSILIGAALFAFVFNIWIVLCYEEYLHNRYRRDGTIGDSVYKAWKYATTISLGSSAVVFFALGLIMSIVGKWKA